MIKKLILLHLALITPLILYNLFCWNKFEKFKENHNSLVQFQNQIRYLKYIQNKNMQAVALYSQSDPQYLYSQIETFPLSYDQKKIQFLESNLTENSFYSEKGQTMTQSVQVDLKDLKLLLEKIEGKISSYSFSPPHLIVQEFSLKKNKNQENILYDLNFKLIKKDYPKKS